MSNLALDIGYFEFDLKLDIRIWILKVSLSD